MHTRPVGPLHREQVDRYREVRARLHRGQVFDGKTSAAALCQPDRQVVDLRTENEQLRAEIQKLREFHSSFLGAKAHTPVEAIMRAITRVSGMKRVVRHGKCRMAHVIYWRRVEQYLLWKRLGLSSTAIGNRTGGRDHSTVLHAIKMVEKDPTRYRADMHKIEALL